MENNLIICPSCGNIMIVVELLDIIILKCFYCNDELPIIDQENISD